MIDKYKLDGKKVVRCETLSEWVDYFEKADRHVALDFIWGMRVSTVFLGLNHNWYDKGDPLLFETMVFVDHSGQDENMRRYSTWEQAEAGHKEVIANIKRHPWNWVVLPWIEFISQKFWRKIYSLRKKLKSATRKLKDKIQAWRQ
jgi:hypothetical protein